MNVSCCIFVFRYPVPAASSQRFESPLQRDAPAHKQRFDDVAPPGTEGYYDLSPPPGIDNLERSSARDDRDRRLREQDDRSTKDHEEDRDRLSSRDDRYK